MSKKRIVIFGYAGSTHVYRWSRSLASRGYQIRVVSLGDATIEGIDVVTLPKSGKFSYIRYASQAAKAARDFNPDIVHVHFAGGHGAWGLKSKFHPMVVSVWGSDVTTSPNSLISRIFIKRVLKKADKITATSKSLLQTTVDLLPETKNKIRVIPFGVTIPEKMFEFPKTKNVSALYLKQLESIYAPDLLIKATAQVVKKFPDFKLTIGGDGSMKEQLNRLIQDLHLENNVTLIGFIDNKKIYDLIRQHHFLVMPSLKEGFGVAAVEAFACSRPVVATNVGGIPEIITNGQNGYMVDPNNLQQLANVMIKMISEKEQMIQMGQNGYAVVKEKFDWEKCVDQMVDVYESF